MFLSYKKMTHRQIFVLFLGFGDFFIYIKRKRNHSRKINP